MESWVKKTNGLKEFSGGIDNWVLASRTAEACPIFKEDDEDEQVSDDLKSCYNCRYRRWTHDSFICMKLNV